MTFNVFEMGTEEAVYNAFKVLSDGGVIIELPEYEMGMSSELVSCMPGFIASIFDVICNSAKNYKNNIMDLLIKR